MQKNGETIETGNEKRRGRYEQWMGEVTQRVIGAWDFSGCGGLAGVDVSAAAGQLSGAEAGYRAAGDFFAAGAVIVRAQGGQ